MTLLKPPVAVDLADLRRIEALLRGRGPCRVRRFDAEYPSLDALLLEHPLPLKRVSFETPDLRVNLERHGTTITGQPGDALDAMVVEIERLALAPIVRLAIPIRLALYVTTFVAIYQEALAWVLPPVVALVVFERAVNEARAKKGAMSPDHASRMDPRMSFGTLAVVMVLARLLMWLFGGHGN